MVYIRIDIGPKFGLGHYYRIKSLINYLQIKKYKIVIDKPLKGDFLKNEEANLIYLNIGNKKINEENDSKNFIKILKTNRNSENIIIKDSYRFNYKWEKKISPYVKKIIIISDDLKNKHYADFYINHNPKLNYLDKNTLNLLLKINKKKCKFLVGTKYSLFNTQINKKKFLPSDIVFYNGGSGDIFIYEKIIDKLLKHRKFKIIMIIGPYSILRKKLELKIKNFKNIKIIRHPKNILNYLKDTKLFVSSASIAMFEASFLRLPSLLFRMNENQNLTDAEYESLGHFYFLEKKDIKNTSKITSLIISMLDNTNEIKKLMFKRGLNPIFIKENYKNSIKLI